MAENSVGQSSELAFDPEKEYSKEQMEERKKTFCQELLGLALQKGDPAIQGYEAAKAFIRYVEPYINSEEVDFEIIIAEFDELVRKAQAIYDTKKGPGENDKSWLKFSNGWKTELASALYFYKSGLQVDLASMADDVFEMTDMIVTDENNKSYRVQVKSIPLRLTHEEMAERNIDIPVLSSLDTLEDFNQFLEKIGTLSKSGPVKFNIFPQSFASPLTEQQIAFISNISLKQVEIEAEPVDGAFHTSQYEDSRHNKLTSLIREALKMFLISEKKQETPVMMLLGSPQSKSSDVNPANCRLRADSQAKADSLLEEIKRKPKRNLPESKKAIA